MCIRDRYYRVCSGHYRPIAGDRRTQSTDQHVRSTLSSPPSSSSTLLFNSNMCKSSHASGTTSTRPPRTSARPCWRFRACWLVLSLFHHASCMFSSLILTCEHYVHARFCTVALAAGWHSSTRRARSFPVICVAFGATNRTSISILVFVKCALVRIRSGGRFGFCEVGCVSL